jgi:hypothetical protein
MAHRFQASANLSRLPPGRSPELLCAELHPSTCQSGWRRCESPEVESKVTVQDGRPVLGDPDDPSSTVGEASVVAEGGEQGYAQPAGEVVALLGPVGAEP